MNESVGGVRFAPSPTGRFHVGNLRTAWISREWARVLALPWVVRFEDIDTPRVHPNAEEWQLADMQALGCIPDRMYRQTGRRRRHWELFLQARDEGRIYPCFCSRREILEALASAPHGSTPVYNGRCRDRHDWPESSHPTVAWRFKAASETLPGSEDFIIARTAPMRARDELPDPASFVPSYQWACAIDDADGEYALIVRAGDLASSLQPQRAVQQWLGTRIPAVFHTALVVADDGHRLEKRTRGVTLPELVQTGISVAALLASFKKQFQLPSGTPIPAAAQILSETRSQLRLSELELK